MIESLTIPSDTPTQSTPTAEDPDTVEPEPRLKLDKLESVSASDDSSSKVEAEAVQTKPEAPEIPTLSTLPSAEPTPPTISEPAIETDDHESNLKDEPELAQQKSMNLNSPNELLAALSLDSRPDPISEITPISPLPPPVNPHSESQKKIEEELNEGVQLEEAWELKTILWPPFPPLPFELTESGGERMRRPEMTIKIIMQNANGPCSLIALCNILILRSDIIISPSRTTVQYDYLAALVADHLVKTLGQADNGDLAAALEILPRTRSGIDLNPQFVSIDSFEPSTTISHGGELSLYKLSGINLVHGWVVDVEDENLFDVLTKEGGNYDRAVERVIEGEIISGQIADEGEETEESILKAVEKRSLWTADEEKKVQDAYLIRNFLNSSPTQLTYHGLLLLSQLPPSSLCAFFRNSHLSVLYRQPNFPMETQSSNNSEIEPKLFTLVTDSAFNDSPGIVWESLEDVEGANSEFFDGNLKRRTGRGRGDDWVRSSEPSRRDNSGVENLESNGGDLELARQLQYEEDKAYRDVQSRRNRDDTLQQNRNGPEESRRSERERIENEKRERERLGKLNKKSKKDCIIM